MDHGQKIEVLRKQGVRIPAPASLEIGEEVKLERIQGPGTVLHSGTKIYGAATMVMPGAQIGYEAPVAVQDCAVGRGVKLAGGYHAGAVYLDGASVGSGAQVRAGTLLEEQANGAHTVGLKQTILLPFVTLGSLINFCDVLMAGGTSREDHSEVGSSFIHFNFTPFGKRGDKATASLIGDVPRGALLRERRIFLGGQAGLVGPVSIGYGTVLAAGCVYRRDHGPDELVVGEKLVPFSKPFTTASYRRVRDKVDRNLRYVGNLAALYHWYRVVRLPLAGGDAQLTALYEQAVTLIEGAIAERVKRLGQLAGYMTASVAALEAGEASDKTQREIAEQRAFAERWPAMKDFLLAFGERDGAGCADYAPFRERAATLSLEEGYIAAIQGGLDDDGAARASRWLQHIVDETLSGAWGETA